MVSVLRSAAPLQQPLAEASPKAKLKTILGRSSQPKAVDPSAVQRSPALERSHPSLSRRSIDTITDWQVKQKKSKADRPSTPLLPATPRSQPTSHFGRVAGFPSLPPYKHRMNLCYFGIISGKFPMTYAFTRYYDFSLPLGCPARSFSTLAMLYDRICYLGRFYSTGSTVDFGILSY